jgi:molybdopterin-guanine dinucleotide biosynthesis protein A
MAAMNVSPGLVVGVILAGGESRRMGGRDKAFLPLAGGTLLSHVVERLAPQVERVVVSANGDAARFAPFGLPVVPDASAKRTGPLAGILAGMRWAAGHAATWIVTVPADTPFIPGDLVARLTAAAVAAPDVGTIAVARSRGAIHPVAALFPVALRDSLAAWLATTGDRAVRTWLAERRAVAVDFPDAAGGVDPFFNVNTPDDLIRAAERLAKMA